MLLLILTQTHALAWENNTKYEIKQEDLVMEFPETPPDTSKYFTVEIQRPDSSNRFDELVWRNDLSYNYRLEHKLLNIAESLYLPSEILFPPNPHGNAIKNQPNRERYVWASSKHDGVKVARSVTKSAIKYYIDKIEEFRRADSSGASNLKILRASFKYRASLTKIPKYDPQSNSYKTSYIVILYLEWEQYCGNLCALSFSRMRIVIFNEAGDIVAVYGEGPYSITMS